MDPNQTQTQAPVQPPTPIQTPIPMQPQVEPKKSNKMVVILVVVLLLAILSGALFYFLRQKQAPIEPPAGLEQTTAPPVEEPMAEEQELESIDPGTFEADFQDLQQSVDQL